MSFLLILVSIIGCKTSNNSNNSNPVEVIETPINEEGFSIFREAVEDSTLAVVEALLKAGYNPNLIDPDGNTAFMAALLKENQELIAKFLDTALDIDEHVNNEINLNVIGNNGQTAYSIAKNIEDQDLKTNVLTLLSNASDNDDYKNPKDSSGQSALMLAAKANNIDDLNIYLEEGYDSGTNQYSDPSKGPDVDVNNNGKTALMLAAEAGSIEAVNALMTKFTAMNVLDQAVNKIVENGFDDVGYSAVVYAHLNNHGDVITALNADLNYRFGSDGATAMMIAADFNKDDAVNAYLDLGAYASEQDNNGLTVFAHAAKNNSIDVINTLIDKAPENINNIDNNSKTPLMYAVENNRELSFNALLTAGAATNIQDINGWSVMHYAVMAENNVILNALISNNSDLTIIRNHSQENPFMLAAKENKTTSLDSFIADSNINSYINDVNGNNMTALMLASEAGNHEIIRKLLKDNSTKDLIIANKDIVDNSNYWSALIWAVHSGNHLAVKEFADFKQTGRDISENYIPFDGRSAIVLAYEENSSELSQIINELTNNIGTSVRAIDNQTDNHGKTPLMHACEAGTSATVAAILNADTGALRDELGELDNDSYEDKNKTALMFAAERTTEGINASDLLSIVDLLITAANNNINIIDKITIDGETALFYAHESGNIGPDSVASRLQNAGANLLVENNQDKTLLMIASARDTDDSRAVITQLLSNVNIDDEYKNKKHTTGNGKTALMYACEVGIFSNVDLLLQNNGVDAKIISEHGDTALTYAYSSADSINIVSRIISGDIHVDSVDNLNNITPLMVAAEKNNTSLIDQLLIMGADKSLRNVQGQNALMIAAQSELVDIGSSEALTTLLTAGSDINEYDPLGRTAEVLARENGRSNNITLLSSNESRDVNALYNGKTALMVACEEGQAFSTSDLSSLGDTDTIGDGTVNILVYKMGADVNFVDSSITKETALHKVARSAENSNHSNVVLVLSNSSANIDAKNAVNQIDFLNQPGDIIYSSTEMNETPLMLAAASGNRTVLNSLINEEALVNEISLKGETALIAAHRNNHSDIVSDLITAGATKNPVDGNNMSAMMYAARAGGTSNIFDDSLAILHQIFALMDNAEKGGALTQLDNTGKSVLMYAAKHNAYIDDTEDSHILQIKNQATSINNLEAITKLKNNTSIPNAQAGVMAHMYAANYQNSALITEMADWCVGLLNEVDDNGEDSMHHATTNPKTL